MDFGSSAAFTNLLRKMKMCLFVYVGSLRGIIPKFASLMFWKVPINVPHLYCTFCQLVPSVFASVFVEEELVTGV